MSTLVHFEIVYYGLFLFCLLLWAFFNAFKDCSKILLTVALYQSLLLGSRTSNMAKPRNENRSLEHIYCYSIPIFMVCMMAGPFLVVK